MNELQIECFFAVAECCNFSRAAEKLYVTQPAVSKQIRSLEERWGVALFHRRQGGVELTAAGKFMLEQMKYFKSSMKTALEQARRIEKQESVPTLRIGLFERHIRQFSVLCSEFVQRYPNLNLIAEEQNFALLNEGLYSRKFDVIVTLESMLVKLNSVKYEPLVPTQYIAFLSRSHPLAKKEELGFCDLVNECWYVPTLGSDEITLNNARNVCAANGFSLHSYKLVPNVKSAMMAVSLNNGAMLLDDSVYTGDFDDYIKIPSGCYSNVILAWQKQETRAIVSELVCYILKNSERVSDEREL